MQWQDLVFAGGTIIMTIALLPSVFSNHKPALTTSVITGLVMLIFTTTYFTLGFIVATITAFFNCCLWVLLAGQKYRQPKKEASST
jgi:hypothetical protein